MSTGKSFQNRNKDMLSTICDFEMIIKSIKGNKSSYAQTFIETGVFVAICKSSRYR